MRFWFYAAGGSSLVANPMIDAFILLYNLSGGINNANRPLDRVPVFEFSNRYDFMITSFPDNL
jgi:hypothetical protein